MPEFLWRWRREIVFTMLVVISLIMLVSHHEPGLLTRSLRQGVTFVIVPFQKVTTGFIQQSRQFFTFFTSMSTLKLENQELKRKIERLTLRNALLRKNQAENQRLREMVAYKKAINFEFIPADMIGRDPSSWLRRGLLDRGQADGVQVGAGVITPHGIAGRVIDVNYYSSTIMLLPDAQSSVAGMIERSGVSGTIKGDNNRALSMIYVSSEDDVQKGDWVVTSKLSTLFPPGLSIGQVNQVNPSANGLMLDIQIIPSVEFKTVSHFLILRTDDREDQ